MERTGPAPGTEIGGYRVLAPLGHGGMGSVYRAQDGGGHVVALKVLHPHLATDPDARERLRREVAHLQRVRHRGVARVLDAEIEQTEAFVVTELLEGSDLATRVRDEGPLGAVELADLAEQVRDALRQVHAAGVLHRDVTPGNVLLTPRGPVLIDFGIAQAVEDARVTSTGMVIGTPGYLSPEALEGAEPSEAGDWWGWAAVLAFAATGRPPFGIRPLQAVLARARAGEADLAGLDRRTAAALRGALAVDPWRRTEPDHVVAELRRVAEDPAADHEDDLGDDDGATAVLTAALTPLAGAAAAAGTQVMPHADRTAVWQTPPGHGLSEGAHGATYADGSQDEADDDTYDDTTDDGPGYGGVSDGAPNLPQQGGPGALPTVPGSIDEVPSPPRRIGSVAAVALALLALGATRPGWALVIAVVLAVLVRSVGLDAAALRVRRARRGDRRGDVAGAVVGWPWYLLRALVGVIPAAVVAASVVVVVGGVGWWLLDSGRLVVAERTPGEPTGELGNNAAWVTTAVIVVAVAVGLLVLWFGPMSRRTRLGARWVLTSIAPGWAGAATFVVLALAAAGVLATLVVLGQAVSWWPMPGPPDVG